MTDEGDQGDESDQGRDKLEALLDLLVYAPIGLVLDAETVAPDLAKRGRQHTAAARKLGELAVKAGKRRVDEAFEQARQSGSDAASVLTGSTSTPTDQPSSVIVDLDGTESDTSASDDLPIADYDTMAASQIVKRLDALSADELEQVREHETANRGRRTILHKLARLQD